MSRDATAKTHGANASGAVPASHPPGEAGRLRWPRSGRLVALRLLEAGDQNRPGTLLRVVGHGSLDLVEAE